MVEIDFENMTVRQKALMLLCEDVGIVPGSLEDYTEQEVIDMLDVADIEDRIIPAMRRVENGEEPDMEAE